MSAFGGSVNSGRVVSVPRIIWREVVTDIAPSGGLHQLLSDAGRKSDDDKWAGGGRSVKVPRIASVTNLFLWGTVDVMVAR